MSIHGIESGRPRLAPEVELAGPQRPGSQAKVSASARAPVRAEISGAARELAEKYASQGLSAERIGQLRKQIEEGIYPQPAVVEELAWRLIESGIV